MNLNPWKWLRKPEPIDFSDVDLEPEPLLYGAAVEITTSLDKIGRQLERVELKPLPGWRARYVRTKGVWAIEVYKLKGKVKEAEDDNGTCDTGSL